MIRNKRLPRGGRLALLTASAVVGLSAAALAAGFFTNGLPQAGQSPYTFTIPLTGAELIPADTQLPGGMSPQSEAISTLQLANYAASIGANGPNALVNGDMSQWQRGTSTSGDIANVLTYWADRWANLGGASSAINVSRQASTQAGFTYALRFARKAANADTAAICTAQVLESADSVRFQGQKAEFTLYAKAGATFSAASSIATVTIATGTGTDGTTANFLAGSWTGYAAAISQPITLTTTMQRFALQTTIPATAVQIGVKICYTPVGTAGATDHLEFTGAQLAVNPGATSGYYGLASGTMPLAFGYRPFSTELRMAQRYYWNITEPAATVMVGASGQGATTTTCQIAIANPVSMRVAPTLAFSGTALTTTTWTVTHVATATALATPFLAVLGANTVDQINMTATVASGLTVGQTCVLTGAGGGSILGATADL